MLRSNQSICVESALSLSNVTKTFGKVRAVDEISLEVPTGSIYGFIGPNGAGKTTTIRMILSILRPDAGTVRVLGHSAPRHPLAPPNPPIDTSGSATRCAKEQRGDVIGPCYRPGHGGHDHRYNTAAVRQSHGGGFDMPDAWRSGR